MKKEKKENLVRIERRIPSGYTELMEQEKEVNKLPQVQAGRQEKKPRVTMISYSIKMVIPTGQYANIQPEIVVKAGTPEEAEAYIAPHMNKLWKEYFMVSERPKPVVEQKIPVPEAQKGVPGVQVPVNQMPPTSSVAFGKASSAIASCLSIPALDIITAQIQKSVKILEEEKPKLIEQALLKQKELNGK